MLTNEMAEILFYFGATFLSVLAWLSGALVGWFS